MPGRALIATIGVAVVLCGCSSDESTGTDARASSTAVGAESTTPATDSVAADPVAEQPGAPETETEASDATSDGAAEGSVAPANSELTFTTTSFGGVKLGASADAAIAELTRSLGPPTNDTGWFDEQQGCDIGAQLRELTWPNLFLSLSSGPSSLGPAGEKHVLAISHFADSESEPRYLTDRGIGIESSVADLRKAYPSAVVLESEIEGPVFATDDVTAGRVITGALSGLDDAATVQSIRIGDICID